MNKDEVYTRLEVAYENLFRVHHELCKQFDRGVQDDFLNTLRDIIYGVVNLQQHLPIIDFKAR